MQAQTSNAQLKKIWQAQKAEGVTDLTFKLWMAQHIAQAEAMQTQQVIDAAATATTDQQPAEINKSALARSIFDAAVKSGSLVRKDVIKQFMAPVEQGGAGLSKHGANTYYQNNRDRLKMVHHKAAATA